ncbi:MAG: YraN family protein [Dehalococcoidales bacterium]|nr:MAG: YraN family protein [Dehalococcoidales bacterium]
MKRKDTGNIGEKLARDHLKKKHHRILETNYSCPHGEIDIISKQKDELVFTEVRTKTGTDFGTPEESITRTKRERMRACALYYLQTHENPGKTWRIDVAAVEINENGKPSRIEFIENAVEEE